MLLSIMPKQKCQKVKHMICTQSMLSEKLNKFGKNISPLSLCGASLLCLPLEPLGAQALGLLALSVGSSVSFGSLGSTFVKGFNLCQRVNICQWVQPLHWAQIFQVFQILKYFEIFQTCLKKIKLCFVGPHPKEI